MSATESLGAIRSYLAYFWPHDNSLASHSNRQHTIVLANQEKSMLELNGAGIHTVHEDFFAVPSIWGQLA